MRRKMLERINAAKKQLDAECSFGGYAPSPFKKFEIKEGKTRLINAPTFSESDCERDGQKRRLEP